MTAHNPIVWKSLIAHGLEICWSHHDGSRWTFDGAATFVEESVPFLITYVLRSDQRTGETRLDGHVRGGGAVARQITITGTAGGLWRIENGTDTGHDTMVTGMCLDLGWTPLTNTLSIWRLDLAIGESADVVNAWFPVPELTLKPAAQRYTRVGERRYRYEQPEIEFVADLVVDEHGFVRRYGEIWEAV